MATAKVFANARFTHTKCDLHGKDGGTGARTRTLTVYTTVKSGGEKSRGYLCQEHLAGLVALAPQNGVVLW